MEPNNDLIINEKASIYIRTRDYSKALTILERVRNPNNKSLLYNYCKIYYETKDQYNFNYHLERALSLYPNDSDFIYIKALHHFDEKEYQKSINFSLNTLSLNPENKRAKDLLNKSKINDPGHWIWGLAFAILLLIARMLIHLSTN